MFLAKNIITQGGFTWLQPKQIGTQNYNWYGVAYDSENNIFNAVGQYATDFYYDDITNAQNPPQGSTSNLSVDVVFNGNTRVIVKSISNNVASGEIYTSINGVEAGSKSYLNCGFESIIYGNNNFIATGYKIKNYGRILLSSDGITWNANISYANCCMTIPTVNLTTYTYIAVGDAINLYNSPMTRWIEVAGKPDDISAYWRCVATNGNIYVVMGLNGYVKTGYINNSGSEWNTAFKIGNNNWYDLIYSGGYFVAVGENGYITTSKDGVNWSKPIQLGSENWRRIAYGNGKFNIVGDNGYMVTGFI